MGYENMQDLLDSLDYQEESELRDLLTDSGDSALRLMNKQAKTNFDRDLAEALVKIWDARDTISMAERTAVYNILNQ